MKTNTYLSIASFAVVLGLSSLANAQSTKGLWISGSGNAFSVQRTTNTVAGLDYTTTNTVFGLTGGYVGIGYQFNEHFLFGGRFGFSVLNGNQGNTYSSGSGVLHFEIPFLTGKVRPFIMIEPGIFNSNLAGTSIYTTSRTGFVTNVGGGAHFFLTDSFSLSPFGAMGFQRYFNEDTSVVSFNVGVLISGWVWK